MLSIDNIYGKVYSILQGSLLTAIRKELPDEVIEDACRKVGYAYRRRLLTPVTNCLYLIASALNREKSFAAVWQMLWVALVKDFGEMASRGYDSSLTCHARQRLPLKVLEEVFDYVRDNAVKAGSGYEKFFGRAVVIIDGTTTRTERTHELEEHYGLPGGKDSRSYFPVMKWVGLMVAGTGVVLGYKSGSYRTSEIKLAGLLWEGLGEGELVIADGYYSSKYTQALLLSQGCDYIMGLHHRFNLKSHRHRKLGEDEYLVQIKLSRRGRRGQEGLPEEIEARVIYYETKEAGRGKRRAVITSLLEEDKYPADEVVRCYGMRWGVETNINEMKTRLHTKRFRSKTVDGVEKELCAHIIAFNIVHLLMLRAAGRKNVEPRRISFVSTVRKIVEFSRVMLMAPVYMLPSMYENLVDYIAADVNRKRDGRREPRALRDGYTKYPVFRETRAEWRETEGLPC